MKKIIHYGIIASKNVTELQHNMVIQIKQGYQPYGPLTVTTIKDSETFYQAIVMYDGDEQVPLETPIYKTR